MKYILEYIWIGGNNEIRTKTKVVVTELITNNVMDIACEWNYDGSSTNQATGHDSEVILKPVKYYKNPFYTNTITCYSYLILCETYISNQIPHKTNTRAIARNIFKQN